MPRAREDATDAHEYQARERLARVGVPIPKGAVAFSPDQAVYAATERGGGHWAVKAQIPAGARGKAGGIRFCRTTHAVRDAATDLLGRRLVTQQTDPGALLQVVVERAIGLQRFDARELAFRLGLTLKQVGAAVRTIMSAYRVDPPGRGADRQGRRDGPRLP